MTEENDPERLEQIRHALESRRQLRQATANFEHAALRPLLLLNGGALIAFVAFLGTDAGSQANKDLAIPAVVVWAFGLVLAAVTVTFGYLSQLAFYKAHGANLYLKFKISEYVPRYEISEEVANANYISQSKRGNRYRDLAHFTGGVSLIAFGVGVIFAGLALAATASVLA